MQTPSAESIRKLREWRCQTQKEAAQSICASVSAWGKWEQGLRKMPAGLWAYYQDKDVLEAGKYALTLTKEQAELVKEALDLYSRTLTGDIGESARVLLKSRTVLPEKCMEKTLNEATKEYRKALGLTWNGYSLMNEGVDPAAGKVFDMLQVVRYCLAWETAKDGKRGATVDFDVPIPFSEDEERFPMPKFRKIGKALL